MAPNAIGSLAAHSASMRCPVVMNWRTDASAVSADRLAVAVRRPEGGYVQLTGNQVGTLLGHYLLTHMPACLSDDAPVEDAGKKLVIASIVSSPMLGAIARALGVRYEETLTGFKWIANRAMEIEPTTGARFVFGYEEALRVVAPFRRLIEAAHQFMEEW